MAPHSGAIGTEAVSSTYAAMSVRYAALAVFLSVDVTTASELAAAVAVSTTGTTPTFVFHLATRPVHRFEGPDMEQLAAVLAQFASAVAAGAGNGGSTMGADGPAGPGMGGGGGGRPSKEERMAAVKANAVTFVAATALVRALPLVRTALCGAADACVGSELGLRAWPTFFFVFCAGADHLGWWLACVQCVHVAGCVRGADKCPLVCSCLPWFPAALTWVSPRPSYWTMGMPFSTETRDGVHPFPHSCALLVPLVGGADWMLASGRRRRLPCMYLSLFFSSTRPPRCAGDPPPSRSV